VAESSIISSSRSRRPVRKHFNTPSHFEKKGDGDDYYSACSRNRGSSVSIVTKHRAGRLGYDSWQGHEFISLRYRVQTGSGVHPMGTPSSSWGVKRPGHEANHSPPANAEVKNAWSYTSIPPHVFTAWCLIKQEICLYGVVLT